VEHVQAYRLWFPGYLKGSILSRGDFKILPVYIAKTGLSRPMQACVEGQNFKGGILSGRGRLVRRPNLKGQGVSPAG